MKREKFESIFEEAYGLEAICNNERSFRLIALFTADNIPQIAVTGHPRSYVPGEAYEQRAADKIDLARFRSTLSALAEDEVFVLGRDARCDYRVGFDVCLNYYKDKQKAEAIYEEIGRRISRYHCFIMKQKGMLGLYDCSDAGTCVMLGNNQPKRLVRL